MSSESLHATQHAEVPSRSPAPPGDGVVADRVMPRETKQAIVVTTRGWKEFTGELTMQQKEGTRWRRVDSAVQVVLGRYGLAWGQGLHPHGLAGPVKRESDQRTPAGVFDLGEARGYADAMPDGASWPFLHSGDDWRCVDDPWSEAYNTFLWTRGMPPAPRVADGVERRELFHWTLFVMHNIDPVVRGGGSCVLLHSWLSSEQPTQGCIGMSRASLGRLLTWLRLEERPLLVVLPEGAYAQVWRSWGLPALDSTSADAGL